MGCWQLTPKMGGAILLYGVGMLLSVYVLTSPLPLGPLALYYSIVTALILSVLALFLSLFVAFFSRSAISAAATIASIPVVAALAGAQLVTEHVLALLGSLLSGAGVVLLFLRRIGESSLDFLRDPSDWSPTALASAALSLWLVTSAYDLPCEISALLASLSLPAAFLSAMVSRNVAESLLLGGLSGLGPIGLTITAIVASFRPLPPIKCEGIEVGRLLGYSSYSSVNRSMMRTKGDEWRQEILACSRGGRAVIALQEPWVLWIYGRDSDAVADVLMKRMGGFRKIEVKGGESSSARAYRLAELYAEISSIGEQSVWLDLRLSGLREEEVESLVFEVAKRARRVVVTLSEVPWKGASLSPKGPARSAGVIVAGLEDPGQAERVAQTLSPQSENLRESLARGRPLFAFPSCEGKLIAFEKDDLKAV
ncbi:MAG: hypothetical protein NZ902_01685 [Acidilobaceae archaeon]|nr:hypothetical protein [Acidilobaceae archaeon]MDW7973963.1 hypothetical protein [Sulfolobales archaeon]